MSDHICNTCKLTLTIEDFYKKKDGSKFSNCCKKCSNIKNKEYRQNNKDSIAKTKSIYSAKNKKKLNKTSKLWDIKNHDRKLETMKNWAASCPDKRAAYKSKRRANKLNAVPKWVDQAELNKIKDLYTEAKRLEIQTGEAYHVDHIIPLVHPLICGFHCIDNLRVIPAKVNLSKGNQFTPYVESEVKND